MLGNRVAQLVAVAVTTALLVAGAFIVFSGDDDAPNAADFGQPQTTSEALTLTPSAGASSTPVATTQATATATSAAETPVPTQTTATATSAAETPAPTQTSVAATATSTTSATQTAGPAFTSTPASTPTAAPVSSPTVIPTSGTATLTDSPSFSPSFDPATWPAPGPKGPFYFTSIDGTPEFFTNRTQQRGIIDLGELGSIALETVVPPEVPSVCVHFTCDPYQFVAEAIVGHVYVVLASEGFEGHFLFLRVTDVDNERVTFDYYYE